VRLGRQGLLHQSNASIIEDPHAVVLVGRKDIDRIHAVQPCGHSLFSIETDGQQQCVLFAFCCSKDESGRTPVRPLGESKSRDALNEPHVPFDFFFGPFFFFVAITLLLGF
jgi:hypothetical protein